MPVLGERLKEVTRIGSNYDRVLDGKQLILSFPVLTLCKMYAINMYCF